MSCLIFPVSGSIEDYLRYAHGLVSEYIDEDLSKALRKHLQYEIHPSSYSYDTMYLNTVYSGE